MGKKRNGTGYKTERKRKVFFDAYSCTCVCTCIHVYVHVYMYMQIEHVHSKYIDTSETVTRQSICTLQK